MSKKGVLVFFYVDDIVLAFRNSKRQIAEDTVFKLKQHYQLTGGEDLQWFLGIELTRNRARRLSWLSQTSYVEKIARLSEDTRTYSTPMSPVELLPFEGMASTRDVRLYQRKIGSLLYAAVTTRPDVAFATSRLARFLTNPGPTHHKAANRVLNYLKGTSTLGLQFGNADDLEVASDASFADNTLDRKSSQAFVVKLFGGTIAWRANKQATVSTSTTEAELLALSHTAKESLYISRLIKELTVVLDDERIRIQCDNQQTLRLVNDELAVLNTRLRHIDIHNHWLRQEVRQGRIVTAYTPSARNMADGLTKALQQETFASFVKSIGLVDVPRQSPMRITHAGLLQRLEDL